MFQAFEKLTRDPILDDLGAALHADAEPDRDRGFRINLIRTTTLIMCAMGAPSFYLYWNLGVHSIAWGIVAAVAFAVLNL